MWLEVLPCGLGVLAAWGCIGWGQIHRLRRSWLRSPGPLTWDTGHAAVEHGGDVATADNAEYPGRRRAVASVDELFQDAAPVRSAEDLAEDGVFDDGELEEFLADLGAMRRADLA